MKNKTLMVSFAGGELATAMFGRRDLDKTQTGLALCRNFIVQPQGAIQNRPGFKYVNRVKDSTKAVRVVGFVYNEEQAAVLEMGEQYLRFHVNGSTIVESAVTITNISAANPAVVTYSGADPAGFVDGQDVYITGVVGTMANTLNGRFVKVDNVNTGANTFQIKTLSDANISTVGLTYTSGGTFARVYEVETDFLEADLFDITITQEADVMSMTHPDYGIFELRRTSASVWTFAEADFTPDLQPPTAGSVTATVASGVASKAYSYVITSVNTQTGEESVSAPASGVLTVNVTDVDQSAGISWVDLASYTGLNAGNILSFSAIVGATQLNGNSYKIAKIGTSYGGVSPGGTVAFLKNNDGSTITTTWSAYTSGGVATRTDVMNDITIAGNYNTITWAAEDDANLYYVYKRDPNGDVYGYIGKTESTQFIDDNLVADVSKTPPQNNDPFTGTGNKPGAVAYHEQRRWFGGTDNGPQYGWATRSGLTSNFNASFPALSNDAFSFRIAARQNNRIRHLVSLGDLLAFTPGGVFALTAPNGEALTPANINPRLRSGAGASSVAPVVTEGSVLYPAAFGGHLYEIGFSGEGNGGYSTNDMSLLATHLLNNQKTIVDMAYMRAPTPINWAVRNDGVLLGFTYLPGQRVYAWHQHETEGLFKSVCVTPEEGIDRLTAVVEREIDGETVKYIERMALREINTLNTDAFFVDAGLSYSGAATRYLYGAWHLEDTEVVALADGEVITGLTVTNGTIDLGEDAEYTNVHIGIAYVSDAETLPIAHEGVQAFGLNNFSNVVAVALRVEASRGVFVGHDFDHLWEDEARTDENYEAPALRTGVIEIPVDGEWGYDSKVCIRQTYPLPLTITSLVAEVALST